MYVRMYCMCPAIYAHMWLQLNVPICTHTLAYVQSFIDKHRARFTHLVFVFMPHLGLWLLSHVCLSAWLSVSTWVCMCVCVYVCMYVCMYVCT